MEVNDNSIILQSSSSTTVADSVWKFINSPIIAILNDLKNATAEQMLRSLLESILNCSATLTTVLIPPYTNGLQNDVLQCQYAAFTTWLFGTMFYIVGEPLSNEIRANSIEIQACMLRILSRHHVTMFEVISFEYMNILQDILEFYKISEHGEELTLAKFNADKESIENLDLQAFPVTIKYSDVPAVQISILKIIEKTGVSMWNGNILSDTVLRILVVSVPNVKIMALNLCTKLVEFSLMNRQELESLILHFIEIVKLIPVWMTSHELQKDQLCQFVQILVQFIQTSPVFPNSIELCFRIIHFVVHELIKHGDNVEAIENLKEIICNKVRQYFIREPRVSTVSQTKEFISYFEHCPDFIVIFNHCILTEIRRNSSGSNLVSDFCEPWKLIRNELTSAAQSNKLDKCVHILRASGILQSWLNELKLPMNLYASDLNDILEILVQNLRSGQCQQRQIIFECFILMVAHNESNKKILQKLLTLPFITQIEMPAEIINNHVKEAAESLDIATKLRCLEALCEFGTGMEALKMLNTCVSNGRSNLAVAALEYSVLLLRNQEIKFEDIARCVLQPALQLEKEEVHERLVIVLGKTSCYLSGHANFGIRQYKMENTMQML